jgi:hypothetical protein
MFHRLVSIKPAKMPPAARKIAEDFRAACMARGVTEDQLNHVEDVFTVNLSQELLLGGPMAFAQAMGALMQLRPNMDEEGGTRLMRDLMTPFVGRHRIDRYRPVINRENLSTSAKSLAQLENNSIITGMAAVAGLDQQHRVHLAVHGEIIAQIMDGGSYAMAESVLLKARDELAQLLEVNRAFVAAASVLAKQQKVLTLKESTS